MNTIHCKQCHSPIGGVIEYDAGDWIVRCAECNAKNTFACTPLCDLNLARVEIIGYRD